MLSLCGCVGAVAVLGVLSGCGEARVGDPAAGHGGTTQTITTSADKPGGDPPSARTGSGATGATGARSTGTTGTTTSAAGDPTGGGVGGGAGVGVAHEVADPEESRSFPVPASSVHTPAATAPHTAGEAAVAAGAPSDAEIRKELGEEERAKTSEHATRHTTLTPVPGGSSVGGNGTIPIPANVPEVVQRVIAGGNAIADFPYIWGGGHDASFVSDGYDCSGSVSYALAAGGLISAPMVSGELADWGDPGPGKWITIYANAGHTFMDVDGVWFDTAGRSGPYDSRWLLSTPPLEGYAVRHPPGL